jgi:hypothetical protein
MELATVSLDSGHVFPDRLAARIEVGEIVWVFSML